MPSNPSAFPVVHAIVADPSSYVSAPPSQPGMSLRDYFAAKAMQAQLSQMTYGNQGQYCGMYDPNNPAQAKTLAFLSYQVADAMLAEREKQR
jgi:hypothetical protein